MPVTHVQAYEYHPTIPIDEWIRSEPEIAEGDPIDPDTEFTHYFSLGPAPEGAAPGLPAVSRFGGLLQGSM